MSYLSRMSIVKNFDPMVEKFQDKSQMKRSYNETIIENVILYLQVCCLQTNDFYMY